MATASVSFYIPPDLYEVVYADISEDVAYWVARARAARGPALEVGCGTGRTLLPCLEAGADMDALELDPAMIEHTRRKAEARGLRPKIFHGDMRDFTLPRRYALVTIPFNAFLHNLTQEDQISALRCCREHLEADGALAFNVFCPSSARLAAMDGEYHVEKDLPHPSGTGRVRISDALERDAVEQILRGRRRIEFLGEADRVTGTHDAQYTLRYVYPHETSLLLRAAGFTRFEVRGGYGGDAPLEEGAALVWTAWKD